ncbi:MAG: hypothetical protein JXP34_26920 [Planctomycetes bacterium]|nr:hypothetical protein [Planctomycetota bacterium]
MNDRGPRAPGQDPRRAGWLAVLVLALAGAGLAPAQSPFLRGDANGDGVVSTADVPGVLEVLFPRGPRSLCPAAADADDDGAVTAADAIRIAQYLAGQAPPPPPPFPSFGYPEVPRLPCSMGFVHPPVVNGGAYVFVDDGTGEPGDTAQVRIEFRYAPDLDGATVRLRYDPATLSLEAASFPESDDVWPELSRIGETAPGEAVLTFLSRQPIEAGTIAEVTFRIHPDAEAGSEPIQLVAGPGGTEVVREGEAIFPATYAGEVRITRAPIAPPRDLSCIPAWGVPLLAWTNGDDYDQIAIERDGSTIALLSGGVELYADDRVPPGPHGYRVRGMRGAGRSTACFARYEGVWVPPPDDAQATSRALEGVVELTWRNGALYDAIQIERNGELIAVVGGDRERYIDRAPVEGLNVYFLSGLFEGAETDRAVATILVLGQAGPVFVRGDANMDGTISLSDIAFLRTALAGEAEIPGCLDACDANDDGSVSPADALAILLVLFGDASPLPPPGLLGGADPTLDSLTCADGRIRWGAYEPSNIVWVGSIEAGRGEPFALPVLATTTFDIEAAQIVLSYDPTLLEIQGADAEGTVLEALGLGDLEVALVANRPDRGYVAIAIPAAERLGTLVIPPFDARPIVRLLGRVREGAAGTIAILPGDCLGPYCLRNEFTYRGRAVYVTIYPRTVAGRISIRGDNPGTLDFLRGDANADEQIDVGDGIFLANYLYAGGPTPLCADSADANDDGQLDAADPIAILMFVFGQGGPLAEACFTCAADVTEDGLPTCLDHPCFGRRPVEE